jgi:hypothetical protein
MNGVRRPQAVPGAEDGRELGGGPVDRAQVESRQQRGQGSNRARVAVLQWLGQHFRQEQHGAETDPREGFSLRWRVKERGDAPPQRMSGNCRVDEHVGVKGIHVGYRPSRPDRIAAISSSA